MLGLVDTVIIHHAATKLIKARHWLTGAVTDELRNRGGESDLRMAVCLVQSGMIEIDCSHWQTFICRPNRTGRLWQGASRETLATTFAFAVVRPIYQGCTIELNFEFRRLQIRVGRVA